MWPVRWHHKAKSKWGQHLLHLFCIREHFLPILQAPWITTERGWWDVVQEVHFPRKYSLDHPFRLNPNSAGDHSGKRIVRSWAVIIALGKNDHRLTLSLTLILCLETKLHHSPAAASLVLYNGFMAWTNVSENECLWINVLNIWKHDAVLSTFLSYTAKLFC